MTTTAEMSLYDAIGVASSPDAALRILARAGYVRVGDWYVRGADRLTEAHIRALWRCMHRD